MVEPNEEQKDEQEEKEEQKEETQEGKEGEEEKVQSDPKTETQDVDERGVPYKNVAAEYKRKAEDAEARLKELENRSYQPNPNPNPNPQQKPDPKAEVDEFVKIGPKASYAQMRAEERRLEEETKANKMIYDMDPKGYQANIQRVIATAQAWNINLQLNASKGVESVFKIWEQEKKTSAESTPASKEVEKQRIEKLKQKQTEGGTKPPAPPVDKSNKNLKNLRERGSQQDVLDVLEDIL